MNNQQKLAKQVQDLRQEGLSYKEIAGRLEIDTNQVGYLIYSYGGTKRNTLDQNATYVALDARTQKVVAKGTISELALALGLTKGTVSSYLRGAKEGRYKIIDPMENNAAAYLVGLILANPELPVVPIISRALHHSAGVWTGAALGEARVSQIWEGENGVYEFTENGPGLDMRADPAFQRLCMGWDQTVAYVDLPWHTCIVIEILPPEREDVKEGSRG